MINNKHQLNVKTQSNGFNTTIKVQNESVPYYGHSRMTKRELLYVVYCISMMPKGLSPEGGVLIIQMQPNWACYIPCISGC